MLGLAIGGAGDEVLAERAEQAGVIIEEPGHPSLPVDPSRIRAVSPRARCFAKAGRIRRSLRVRKGLPLAGGQGGQRGFGGGRRARGESAAGPPAARRGRAPRRPEAEAIVAGRHADNIVAILWAVWC